MIVYFANDSYEELCPIQEAHVTAGETSKVSFSLNASASSLNDCYLVIKSTKDAIYEAQQLVKHKINIAFNVEFDF